MADRDWQEQLRDALDGYGERVPDALWESVDSAVSQGWRRRRIRRRAVWGGICGIAAAVATTFVVVRPRTGSADPAPLLVQAAAPAVLAAAPPDGTGRADEDARPQQSRETLPMPGGRFPDGAAASPAGAASVPRDASAPADSPDSPDPAGPGTDAAEDGTLLASGTGSPDPKMPSRPQKTGPDPAGQSGSVTEDPGASDFAPRAADRNRASLRLALSNLQGIRSARTGYGAIFGSEVISMLYDAPVAARADSYSAVLLENNFREVNTDMHHYQPLRFALTAAWDFSERLALESGLSYSCLVSDLRSGTDDSRYEIRQTLHYVGIPLRVDLKLWSLSRLDLYLSGGVTAEKCVAGRSVTSYYVGATRIDSGTERIMEDPLQWSANLSAGLSWDLGSRFRLFAEPGASLYFDNGSFVQTLYRDRPFHFELSVGMRYVLGR